MDQNTNKKQDRRKAIGLIFIMASMAFALILLFPIALEYFQSGEGPSPKIGVVSVIVPMLAGVILIFWENCYACLKMAIAFLPSFFLSYWFVKLCPYYTEVSHNRLTTCSRGLLFYLIFGVYYLAFFYVITPAVVELFKRIHKSRQAQKSLLLLFVFYLFMLVVFSMTYAQIDKNSGGEAFSCLSDCETTENASPGMGHLCKEVHRKMGFSDYFYFSVVTATTLGYGDICPKNGIASVAVCVQVVVTVLTVSLFISAIVSSGFLKGPFFDDFLNPKKQTY